MSEAVTMVPPVIRMRMASPRQVRDQGSGARAVLGVRLGARVSKLGLQTSTDAAGNNWVTVPGASSRTVIIGGHLDSVPNGGWLDGALGVLAGLEALRMHVGT